MIFQICSNVCAPAYMVQDMQALQGCICFPAASVSSASSVSSSFLYLVGLQGLHLLQGFIICICFPASSSARLHLHLLSFKPLHPASRVHLFHHHLHLLSRCFKAASSFKPFKGCTASSFFKGASYHLAPFEALESPLQGFKASPGYHAALFFASIIIFISSSFLYLIS